MTASRASAPPAVRVRTVTAGVSLASGSDLTALRSACEFARTAGDRFAAEGYEVQTMRVATQSATEYLGDIFSPSSRAAILELDEIAASHDCLLSLGPLEVEEDRAEALAERIAELLAATTRTSVSVTTADRDGLRPHAIHTAAQAIRNIAEVTPGGEGNFRFAAAANIPAGTPFFPVAYHCGEASFGIGCETPGALAAALDQFDFGEASGFDLRDALEGHLAPIVAVAKSLATESGRPFNGIDTSPAPGLDASIGAVIESISGRPFGASGTLAACATLTAVIKSLRVPSCGYRGLFLPVLEDLVLAQRASEGHFGIHDLLLFSAVCGTGLDVVPVAGETPVETLEGLVMDVSALSSRLKKPLSVRLFPIPGRSAGDRADFENPYLASSKIMPLD